MNPLKSLVTFVSGVAVGIVIGMLIAPEEGKVTRNRIKYKAKREIDQLKGKLKKNNGEKVFN